MSDEEFQQAKRVCERHGYRVTKTAGGIRLTRPDEPLACWVDPRKVITVTVLMRRDSLGNITEHAVRVEVEGSSPSMLGFLTLEEATERAEELRHACWGR